ncbi:hypothetical protein OROHE_002217 [Orobanche hederae]
MGNILIFLGQDPQISHEAGRFLTWLVPALFGYGTLQPLIRYYQMQNMVLPMLSGLGSLGGAVAMGISMWLNVTILSLYMIYSPKCAKTRAPISMSIFEGVREFFRFAIPSAVMIWGILYYFEGVRGFFRFAVPSAVMICLEWWSFELVILLSGLLPNPQLETSVLSVCLNTIATLYSIPYGLAAAASTRISNELGAGKPEGARVTVVALILLGAVEAIVASSCLFASRHVFGYIFSNEKEVVDYVTNMAPLLCLSVIIDSIQGTLSARCCQRLWVTGAYINLAAFYLFGVPIAVILGFWLNLRGKGLWTGILCGASLQTIMLSVITGCTNWEKQLRQGRD